MLSLQVSHHISLLGPEALIRRCDDLPATITHVPVAAVLVLNAPDDGLLRPKHVEWPCRNKTCTVLHQVGVSFVLYYDARKHKIKIKLIFLCFTSPWEWRSSVGVSITVMNCILLSALVSGYGSFKQRLTNVAKCNSTCGIKNWEEASPYINALSFFQLWVSNPTNFTLFQQATNCLQLISYMFQYSCVIIKCLIRYRPSWDKTIWNFILYIFLHCSFCAWRYSIKTLVTPVNAQCYNLCIFLLLSYDIFRHCRHLQGAYTNISLKHIGEILQKKNIFLM